MNNFLKSWHQMLTLTVSILTPDACGQGVRTGTNKKTPTKCLYKCLIFFKIRSSLTTSKEGLMTLNIHLDATRIYLRLLVVTLCSDQKWSGALSHHATIC